MLIDDRTEYFRSHLKALGKTERRIYIAVLNLWQHSTPGEIAARARTDVRVVSTMLGRLVERGALVVKGGGRKRKYAAAEPLYCIYYKLRRGRGKSAIVENLIRFMSVFYSEEEWAQIFPSVNFDGMESSTLWHGLDVAAAMDMFRTSHDVFEPDDDGIIRNALQLIPELIAAGASVHELLEILLSNTERLPL